MSTFLTLIGIAAAIIVFLNLLNARDQVERLGKPERPRAKLPGGKTIGGKELKEAARVRRRCPVCRTPLLDHEYLICGMDPEEPDERRRQVHIYGCTHCFSSDGVNMKLERMSDLNVGA